MRAYLLCFLALLLCTCVRAQTSAELIEALDDADTDDERYGILYDLTGQLLESGRREDKTLAVTFSKQLYSTAQRLGDTKLVGPAAYTLALAYRGNRDDKNTDKFMAQAVEKARQPDLIMLAVAERNRLATKARNYRDAAAISQRALDYFTRNGDDRSLSALRAQLKREQAALQRRKREIEQETRQLAGEVNRLSAEKERLSGSNRLLQGSNQKLQGSNQQLKKENLTSKQQLEESNRELNQTQEENAKAERQIAESKKEISVLGREALEQRILATEAHERLVEAELERQQAEMKAERQRV